MSEIKKVKINDAVHEGLKSESAHKEHVAEINHIAIEDYNVNESVQQSYKSLIEYMLSTEYIENLIEITSTTNSSESTGDAVIDLTGTELAGYGYMIGPYNSNVSYYFIFDSGNYADNSYTAAVLTVITDENNNTIHVVNSSTLDTYLVYIVDNNTLEPYAVKVVNNGALDSYG